MPKMAPNLVPIVQHDGYRRLLADITDAPSPAPETPRTCPDCGGPLLPTITQRASGLGPGPVLLACTDAQTLPWLPVDLRAACGGPNLLGRAVLAYAAWVAAGLRFKQLNRRLNVAYRTRLDVADLQAETWAAWDAEQAAGDDYVRACDAAGIAAVVAA